MQPPNTKHLGALVVSLVLAACATTSHQSTVVIDGTFDEWGDAITVADDPMDAPDGFVDFGAVKIRHDRDAVYFLVNVGRMVTAQRLKGTVSLLLDVDGETSTGHSEHGLDGVDVVLEFPLPNERAPGTPGAGIRLRALTGEGRSSEPINAYSVGFQLAPVHAGNVFEMRIDRRGPIGPTPPLFQSTHFHGRFVAVNLKNVSVDATDVFTYELTHTNQAARQSDGATDPLKRLPGTDFRILIWNVSRGAHIRNPEPFERILGAVKPDILVFDEIPPTTNAKELAAFLTDAFITDSWNVYFGEGGDDQRTVVASRSPVEAAEPFRKVPWGPHAVETLAAMMPDDPDAAEKVRENLGDSVPTGGAIVSTKGRRLLLVGADLACCGGYETIQDRRRILEAEAINGAVRETLSGRGIDGVIVGGDFNLVGDPVVLTIAGSEAAPDGKNLERVRALQIDGLSDATWANPDEPFVPGRLDNVLYSTASLAVVRAFVFDSSDLNQRWQAYYGVRAGDNLDASDHFPIVVDFKWIDREGPM